MPKKDKMAKKKEQDCSKSARCCEVETRLYGDDGEVYFDMDNLNTVLAEKANCIDKYAWIIHDKDVYTEKEQEKNPNHIAGTPKPPHIHLLLYFQRNQPQRYKHVAGWFGLGEQFVSRIKRGWNNAVLYLAHVNAPEKHQYNPEDITSNFNVKTIINHAEDRKQLNLILQKILSGEIREYNKALDIDNLTLIYHAKEINEAFKTRSAYLQATRQNRNTEVMYITGPSGCGKTTLAKKIAADRKLDYYVSSGSNDVLDGYAQQPCLILDDIRPSCLGMSDLLKLLDNHTASLVKSRYKNKYLNCDLIILTSVMDINLFYSHVFEKENEPITQLKRRCGTYVQMDTDIIYISRWDSAAMRYSKPHIFKNDILSKYVAEQPKTAEQVQREIEELMPFLTPEPLLAQKIGWCDLPCSYSNPPEEIVTDMEFEGFIHMDEGGDSDG